MDDLIEEIRTAVRARLWRLALAGTMTLPDICAVLESSGTGPSARYKAWWDQHMQSSLLEPHDAWLMRCGLIHEGVGGAGPYSRVLFVDRQGVVMHNNVIDDVLNLDMATFTEEVIAAVKHWQARVGGSDRYLERLPQLLRWHPDGFPPYIVGIPVLG